jgi:hypothetical protein
MAVVTFPNPSQPSPITPQFPMSAQAITKSDTDTFERPVSVFVGVAGDVVVVPAGHQTAVTFTMPAGGVIPVLVGAVKSTNTTASGLVALY